MGLSLRNIGKKIEDVVGAGVNDVSHIFGGGQAPAPPVPRPVLPPIGPQPPSGIQRGGLAPPPDFLANNPNAQGGGITPYQTPGIVKNVIRPALRTIPEAIASFNPTQQTYHPGPGIQQALFGQTPVQNIEKKTINTYQTHPGGGALPLAIGEAVGSLAQDIPTVGSLVKGAKVVARPAVEATVNAAKDLQPLTEAGGINNVVKAKAPPVEVPIAPAEKAAATTKSPTVPQAPIPAPAVAAHTTNLPEVDAAIKDVAAQHSAPTKFSGTIQDVVKQAQGQSSVGSRAANGLRKALSKNLSKAENQSVSDIMDNHPGAYETATPKAQGVAKALKLLQDQGFAIRQAVNPNVNRVQDYVSRIPANTVGAAVNAGSKVLGKIRSLSDITNLNSVFSQSRKVGKFVDNKGSAVYGDPAKLGLVQHNDGTVTNAAGNAFKQVAVSKRELEANGAGQYEHNISRISGIYHADTASLKVRAEALQHIKANPEALGLSEVQGPGMVPVSRVGELAGYYGNPKDVKALEDNFGYKNATGPIGKVYDAASNIATQFIVLNPFFHGMNQLYQTGIAAGNMPGKGTGWWKAANHVFDVGEQDIRDYLSAGGHIPDYGMGRENLLSNMTHGVSKINNKAMSGIETRLRVGLYKASIDSGMKPKAAIGNIDKFLGDSHQMTAATRRFTLFFHYFKTMATALGSQVAHPIENKGSIANTAALAAITAAVTEGYRKMTGNNAAYVRVPGELGLVKEAVQSGVGLAQGSPAKASQVVTNRVNPVLKEAAQQGFNKDLFTGKSVTDTGRLAHAVSGTIAPAQTATRVTAGKKGGAETGLNQLGLYTPHAKGYQASPNLPINTKGAIPGNGEKEQNAYFNGLSTAQKALSGDKASTDAFTKFVDRSHDPNTGQSIQNSPSESQQNSEALATNDKLRGAVQKFESSQPSHDPMWDLPAGQLKALMQYKAQFTGDAAKNFLFSQATQADGSNWIKDIEAKQADYYNNVKYPGGSKIPEKNPQTPAYPKFDAQTQTLLDQYDAGTSAQKSALLQDNGPQISKAWQQKADWTNAMRKAEGAPALKSYPVADAQTQQILSTYNALPKGNGPKGGSPTRAAWIKANPSDYAKMQSYLSQASLSSLVKNASLDQFQGATADQTLLKDIKNIGTYDIAATKNADGTTSYALNPAAAAAAYGSSFSSSGYKNTADYRAYKDAKALKYTNKIPRISARIKRPSVKIAKGRAGHARVSLAVKGGSKVSLKPSKV